MKVFPEITPVQENDLFFLQHHPKADFDYPIHLHEDFEITLVEGCNGSRAVGNSIENYEHDDLVLIGPNLQHKWMKDDGEDMPAVTTIQFKKDIFSESFLGKRELTEIKQLIHESGKGIVFHGIDKHRIKLVINELIKSTDFRRVLLFFEMLYLMAVSSDKKQLASDGFVDVHYEDTSRRINIVIDHIFKNFHRDIPLSEVSQLVSMSNSAFSHFFRKRTNKSFVKFVNDVRLGKATFFLVNSSKSVAEICYECGFNNLSNFNRQFKKQKGITPSIYRKEYQNSVEEPI
ncbi:AraC family transcriptional regulator [Sediminitomix flava]|uniref:AraC-like DNA-binding protein n=1 Tax=Sediminitomix flava TaxID=379075 RepID=A0A315ZCZ4_SEDFL|nr:AraC family transcriptional regulator [Sediminitomix flava]PWJ43152.1 AraC-like DNA-binding protein [Sediminitomix flava]